MMMCTFRTAIRFLVLPAILVLLLGGCIQGTPEQEATPAPEATEAFESALELVGTSWSLDYMGEDETAGASLEGVRSTINFLVGRYLGSAGCNWYQGMYDATPGPLWLGTPFQTSIVCSEPPGVMDQDGLFFGALISASGYELEAEKLVLYREDGQRLMTFSPSEDVSFEGTNWGLKQINNGSDWFALALGSEISALFADGELSGNGGCNNYTATYEAGDGTLAIDGLAATEMACDVNPDVLDQEQVYLSVLGSVASYEVLGGALVLLDDAGNAVLIYGAQ